MPSVSPRDVPTDRARPCVRARGSVFAILALGLFFQSGCATTTRVSVDSLAKPNVDTEAGLSYEIHSANPLVPDDSLRYREAAEYVKTALSGKGMYEAPPDTQPDVIVDLDYGIGPPESRIETRTIPVQRVTPGKLRAATVMVGTAADGTPLYGTVWIQDPPTIEYEDHEQEVKVTSYEKYLRLTARSTEPVAEGRPQPEIWTVNVSSEGESRDLRKTLPVLVAASIQHIGKDTKGEKVVSIKDEGEDVAFVKKGM